MAELNNASLAQLAGAVDVPTYDREATHFIAQLNPSKMACSHLINYTDQLRRKQGDKGGPRWGVKGISLRDSPEARRRTEIMRRQDALYTLTEFSPDGQSHTKVVGALLSHTSAVENPDEALSILADPRTYVVSTTLTKNGYNVDPTTGEFITHVEDGEIRTGDVDLDHDLQNPDSPRTAFGLVAQAARLRRDNDLPPLTVLSYDNAVANGTMAKTAFVSYAKLVDPALGEWMESHFTFPNCMLDRITPATTPEDQNRLNALSGVEDAMPIQCESHAQLVIEDKIASAFPPFAEFNVDVQIVNDFEAYQNAKLQLLNASHMMLCFPAILAGFSKIDEAINQAVFRAYLEQFMTKDVIPHLQSPKGMDLTDYKDDILARFGNASLPDPLARIAREGAPKIGMYLIKMLVGLLSSGDDPCRVAFLMACFMRYLGGLDDNKQSIAYQESKITAEDLLLAKKIGPESLHISPFRKWQLYNNPKFVRDYTMFQNSILEIGVVSTMELLVDMTMQQDAETAGKAAEDEVRRRDEDRINCPFCRTGQKRHVNQRTGQLRCETCAKEWYAAPPRA